MDTSLIIFDLDGTLIDTMGAFAAEASALLERHYGLARGRAHRRYLQTSGLPFCHQLEQIFPGDPRNDAVSGRFEHWKRGFHANGHHLRPGVEHVLLALKGAGLHTSMSSNNLQENVDRLARWWPIDASLGFRPPGFCKGERHFQWFEARFGVQRSEMAFVGDSPHDAAIARLCGVPFFGLTGAFDGQDFTAVNAEARNLADIRELCAHLLPDWRDHVAG